MGQVHQRGSLNAGAAGVDEESAQRGANPLAVASQQKLSPSERLVRQIAAHMQRRGLSAAEAATIVKETPLQMTLLLRGKLFGVSVERLQRILTRLVDQPAEGDAV